MSTVASGKIAESVCHGTLTIDGFSMNRDAWAVLNNFVLWQGAEQRGSDYLIPGRPGQKPNRRRKDATKRVLEILVIGDVDRLGVETGNRVIGLEDNMAWLQANVFDPAPSADGTRTLVLTLPSGKTRTGIAHVGPATLGSVISGAFTVTLDVSLPYGELGPPEESVDPGGS